MHRLQFDNDSVLQNNPIYKRLFDQIWPDGDTGFIPPGSSVTPQALGAAKAIAAYERTILANDAPFQRWLQGHRNAMNSKQLKGALLFFGKANCVSCHTGPALSSLPDASEDRIFFDVGFSDFNTRNSLIHGSVPDDVKMGRGGFTGNKDDYNKFKIPTIYNTKNTKVLGHGASFKTVLQVVKYKNRARPQRPQDPEHITLADEFVPLDLSSREMSDLTSFVRDALYDPNLNRYQPKTLPTDNCVIAADIKSVIEQKCW